MRERERGRGRGGRGGGGGGEERREEEGGTTNLASGRRFCNVLDLRENGQSFFGSRDERAGGVSSLAREKNSREKPRRGERYKTSKERERERYIFFSSRRALNACTHKGEFFKPRTVDEHITSANFIHEGESSLRSETQTEVTLR